MINPMDMSGKVVLVTGASSGIGRETSLLLSRLGASLVLVGRNSEKLNHTASCLEGAGHYIEPFDLAQTDEIPLWMERIVKKTGPINGLVHSAGVQLTRPIRFLKRRDIEDVMSVNAYAAFGLAKGFRQKGICAKGGSIVFISSVAGLFGQPGISAYSASKGALIALTKSLAMELAREGLRVNNIAPANVKTEMQAEIQGMLTPEQFAAIEARHPLGIGAPLDVAYAVAFLLADTSRWITGTTLIVDGGYTAT